MSSAVPREPYRFENLARGMSATTRRTFDRTDIEVFRNLAPDSAPIHTDPAFARQMGYRDVIVFGWLAAAPFSGLLGNQLPGPLTVLHSVRISTVAPVYVGDEILYRAEIVQLSNAVKVVVLELVATRTSNQEIVVRGQAQCGFRT
jgi:3-hydroxybutyryl-CoA dehydratase